VVICGGGGLDDFLLSYGYEMADAAFKIWNLFNFSGEQLLVWIKDGSYNLYYGGLGFCHDIIATCQHSRSSTPAFSCGNHCESCTAHKTCNQPRELRFLPGSELLRSVPLLG
jgi:hypothetical protein